ncbi:MAG: DUF4105 domain-containing protein [Cyclobacteriaceae bacterium]|nr:DUF4105 domain-containing protein [Cyclobacteriaceae bacterium]
MVKKLVTILLLLPVCIRAQQLSQQAFISVITCGPGQTELYSAFGHSAFRVHDPMLGIDYAYNYGVFDFSQPNFYLNFARGHNFYKLAVQDYRQFEYFYRYFNRYVHEQVLDLTQHQKQRLFDFLQWNALPENRSYRYDYFYDNCATKIPAVLKQLFGDSLQFTYPHITTAYSFRQLTDFYLEYQPWGDLGIDLCLGLPMDKKATPFEYMFLPDYVEAGMDYALLNGRPLVKQKNIVYQPVPEEYSTGWLTPFNVFILFSVITLALSIYDWQRKKISYAFDRLLFGITGLIGIILLLLWTATDHRAAAWNFNLLWAVPLHFPVVFIIKKTAKWIIFYFKIITVILLLLLTLWVWLPQQLHFALIPVVLSLLMRSWIHVQLRPKQII